MESKIIEHRGHKVRLWIEHDPDAEHPADSEGYDREQVDAWRRDEWEYVIVCAKVDDETSDLLPACIGSVEHGDMGNGLIADAFEMVAPVQVGENAWQMPSCAWSVVDEAVDDYEAWDATRKIDGRGVVEVLDVAGYLAQKAHASVVTCGECKRSWDDAVATSWTPAPSARCVFEDEHEAEADLCGACGYWVERGDTHVCDLDETRLTKSEELLTRWIRAELIVISEFGGDFNAEWAQLIEDAKGYAQAICIPWRDDLIPDYVRDAQETADVAPTPAEGGGSIG